jgi:hypothetical protein
VNRPFKTVPGDRQAGRQAGRGSRKRPGTHPDPVAPGDDLAASDRIDVRLLDRRETESIDPAAWASLARHSRCPNPFYESWNLLPALRHLEPRAEIKVVTVYRAGELAALFPVCVQRRAPWRYLKVWCFRDCLISDVLQLPGIALRPVVQTVMRRLAAMATISPMHSPGGFDLHPDRALCRFERHRKAITRFDGWDAYESRLPRKDRKENRRVIRRLLEREGIRYATADSGLVSGWLPGYLQVEQGSWKTGRGNAIAADEARLGYFREAISAGEAQHKVQFQGLFDGAEPIAMSFRFTAQSHAFEIKTSYLENRRRLYPGVVLELLNLRDVLAHHEFSLVDSCAFRNRVVDRIWPDQIPIMNSITFADSVAGHIADRMTRLYRTIRRSRHCRPPPWAR